MKQERLSPRRYGSLLLCIFILACMPAASQAALVVTSVATNNTTSYSVTVNWTAEPGTLTIETLGCGVLAPVLALTCSPWNPSALTGTQSALAPGAGEVSLYIQHLTGPHNFDVNPGTGVPAVVKLVSPGIGGGTITVLTPHDPHYDWVTLTVTPTVEGVQSEITILAEHMEVPEPGSLALGAMGASALLLGRSWRRRRG